MARKAVVSFIVKLRRMVGPQYPTSEGEVVMEVRAFGGREVVEEERVEEKRKGLVGEAERRNRSGKKPLLRSKQTDKS